ncbi:MAG: DUF92 domain-containing protein [Candidatus ainarchaeum sp.]|nr:DUF92 domain-containing protein [Candidatus ainarchaeum sp.]
MLILTDFLIVAIVLVFFSIVSYALKLLDFQGVLIANVVGLAAITFSPNPLLSFLTVVVFFVIGEVASNFPKKKHEKRNIWNVVGNSLPALVALCLIISFPEKSFLFELAFFGAISAALSDTLSSEIGYFSKSLPISIITFKKVPKGEDGGVTILGELAALFGAIIISIIYFLAYQNMVSAIIVIFAGMVGTNVDSIMGALFETKKILSNTHVNLIGCASGAIFAFLVGLIFLI